MGIAVGIAGNWEAGATHGKWDLGHGTWWDLGHGTWWNLVGPGTWDLVGHRTWWNLVGPGTWDQEAVTWEVGGTPWE